MSGAAKSAREIFVTFTRIGASGFGGVNFWIRRVLVQEKRWITDREYLEGLALGQILPGPNVYHLTVMQLFWHFLLLGCVAVGGVSTVMPDMYRYVVDENAMVTGRQFSDLYALAQAAPGPNALWVTLLGLQAAGWSGALATTLGILVPATAFSLLASTLHARHADT